MMVQTLGYQTDLIFPRYEGEVIDRGDYLVILTPSNPSYYWGNFLLFDTPPAAGDYERWTSLFRQEIGAKINAKHMAFGWDTGDGEAGEAQPFVDDGFRLDREVILTTDAVHIPPKFNQEVTIRTLLEDWEWEQAIQIQIEMRSPEFGRRSYEVYKRAQFVRYRRMAEAGLGAWFGAFLGDDLVADLGVFTDQTVARFQLVETHPDYRRRGICGALVYHASRYALDTMGVTTLVMKADEAYHAAKIYESVGFKPTERNVTLDWWDRSTYG